MPTATTEIDLDSYPGEDGLLFACKIDGKGGGALADWAEVEAWTQGDGPIWLHLDRTTERAKIWLKTKSGLTPITVDALLSDDTRPRTFRGKRGTIAVLRGVNTNPGADPEDLVGMRLWSDGGRLITLRHRRLQAPREVLIELVRDGIGPASTSELFERLVSRLAQRMGAVIEGFEDELDAIEQSIETVSSSAALKSLGEVRSDTVTLRRYMAPQREAVSSLYLEPPEWLDDHSRQRLRETSNRLMQYVEALDEARERAVVLKDDISNQLSEKMNKNMFVLSIVAAIFLPLGFITGLFGINVGGMPGVDSADAFWITCAAIGALLLGELALFRVLKWI